MEVPSQPQLHFLSSPNIPKQEVAALYPSQAGISLKHPDFSQILPVHPGGYWQIFEDQVNTKVSTGQDLPATPLPQGALCQWLHPEIPRVE